MPLLPDTWTGNQDDGDPLDGTKIDSYLNAIRTIINALDNLNIAAGANIDAAKLADATLVNAKLVNSTVQDGKLLWADATNGVRALRTTLPQRKAVWGKTAFTVVAGNDEITVAVTFATGADTPTAFASATDVIVVCTVESTIVDGEELICDINAVTATGFNVVVRTASSGNVAANRTGFVHWHAFGRTA